MYLVVCCTFIRVIDVTVPDVLILQVFSSRYEPLYVYDTFGMEANDDSDRTAQAGPSSFNTSFLQQMLVSYREIAHLIELSGDDPFPITCPTINFVYLCVHLWQNFQTFNVLARQICFYVLCS